MWNKSFVFSLCLSSRMERNRKCYTIPESALCKSPTAINIFHKMTIRTVEETRGELVLAHILFIARKTLTSVILILDFYCSS